ncbi:MAG TPA: hypothetical protein VLB44_13365 [Kofleriaceae bacterium]|nr:hypothetical protein [Kofleriaceae bacterium]
MATCETHADRTARRECTQCDKTWCMECVRVVGSASKEICAGCGALVRTYRGRGSTDEADVVDAIRRPFTIEGITTALAFAVFYWIGGALGILVLFHLSALVAYYFTVIHHVAGGGEGLPGPSDATDSWTETLGFVFRGIACLLVGAIPLIVARYALGPIQPPTALALLIAGQALMPAALIAVFFTSSTVSALYPVAWVQVIARAPGAYAKFAAIWLGSVVVGLALFYLGVELLEPVPFVGRLLAAFVWNVFWFAQASLVGAFVRNNARAFGF